MREVKSSVEGWLSWELVNPSGVIVQAGEQHNLILNSGLDWLASVDVYNVAAFMAVGTGSTVPDVTQTGLAAQVARTSSNGGIGESVQRVSSGKYRITFTREFSETQANGNLTEWGVSPSSTGALFARELFRDGSGNPVVVTKDSAQKLRMVYTFELTITPTTLTAASVTITGLGTRTGRYSWLGNDQSNADFQIMTRIMRGAAPDRPYHSRGSLYVCDQGSISSYSSFGFGANRLYDSDTTPPVIPAYVQGSYQRGGYTYALDTTQGNGTINSLFISCNNYYSNAGAGWGWVFDAGQEIVKSNLDRMTFTGPSVSWGRA